jgi:hypothetical protein
VEFRQEPDGTPAVEIHQHRLGISNVVVRFAGESLTNPPSVALPCIVAFDKPRRNVPFGRVIFDDLMYLPGTVVLHCFGHEVQMLPRCLYLNRREHPWNETREFRLTPAAKSPAPEVN